MSKNSVLVLVAFAVLGCRTSMSKRKDASPGPEAGLADVALDARLATDRMASDTHVLDAFSSDGSTRVGVPKAFRIENHTDRTLYVQTEYPVDCQVAGTSGWQRCTYFKGCPFLCPQVQDNNNCCVSCEQNLELYAIPAGQSRAIPWDGRIFMRQTGPCSECQCDQPIPVTIADFEASVRVYNSYRCMNTICQPSPDGILRTAEAIGPSLSVKVPFSVPLAGEEVVIVVPGTPPPDGGALDALTGRDSLPLLDAPVDSALADSARDRASETARATLADVAGRQFTIAADEALPDASLDGRSCGTSNPGAHYQLTFSDDGTQVTVVRTDPVQETALNGTLRAVSSRTLDYELLPAFAGAWLKVRREGSILIGNLILQGSGVPVIWCIESPMRPV